MAQEKDDRRAGQEQIGREAESSHRIDRGAEVGEDDGEEGEAAGTFPFREKKDVTRPEQKQEALGQRAADDPDRVETVGGVEGDVKAAQPEGQERAGKGAPLHPQGRDDEPGAERSAQAENPGRSEPGKEVGMGEAEDEDEGDDTEDRADAGEPAAKLKLKRGPRRRGGNVRGSGGSAWFCGKGGNSDADGTEGGGGSLAIGRGGSAGSRARASRVWSWTLSRASDCSSSVCCRRMASRSSRSVMFAYYGGSPQFCHPELVAHTCGRIRRAFFLRPRGNPGSSLTRNFQLFYPATRV